jgi:hypothetical protein
MAETFSPFDSIKKLSETKEPHTPEELSQFNQWMVVRGFSMDRGTILYADAVNRTGLDNKMVHDWFLTALPKKRFFAKWSKASKADDRLKMVQQKYQCNRNTALTYISLMSEDDFKQLEESLETGGRDKKK